MSRQMTFSDAEPVVEGTVPSQGAATAERLRVRRAASHDPIENAQIRVEVALYIGSMASELASMARAANFDVLAYFLEMAKMEARLRLGEMQVAEPDEPVEVLQPRRA